MSRTKENRKVTRVQLATPLKVVMGSIGTPLRYDLLTRNVSYTGFFLDFEKPGRFPFTPASILEVWLDLGDGQTLFFNGKLARVVMPGDPKAVETGPGIAIRIVQIDKKSEDILRQFVDAKITNSLIKSA
jgi:hypothetical protein